MYIADLHIHSRYSRATSRELTPETLELSARRKGIRILPILPGGLSWRKSWSRQRTGSAG